MTTPPAPVAPAITWTASCTVPREDSAVVAARSLLTQILDMWDIHGGVHAAVAVMTGVLVESAVAAHGGSEPLLVEVGLAGANVTVSVTDQSGHPARLTGRTKEMADQLGAHLTFDGARCVATLHPREERSPLTLLPQQIAQ